MLLYWILLPIVWPLLHILWRIEVVGKENIPRGRAHVIASWPSRSCSKIR